MRQILLDGKPFTYGDSLEDIAEFSGIDIARLSWGDEFMEEPLTPLQQLEITNAKAHIELLQIILSTKGGA